MRLQVCLTLMVIMSLISAQPESQDTGIFEIDNAKELLSSLRIDTSQSRNELETNWNQVKNDLLDQIVALNATIVTKQSQCDSFAKTAADSNSDIVATHKYIDWLATSIDAKKDKLQTLLTRRCDVNKVFIDGLKRDKVALSLLEFIKTAIEKKQSFSLLQKGKFDQQLASFLEAYHSNDLNFLLQMKDSNTDAQDYKVDVDFTTSARNENEIGKGYIDNTKGDLSLDDFVSSERKDWYLYKQELVNILEGLKKTISDKMKNAIQDEIQASVALANYKNNILHEIQVFEGELEKQKTLLTSLEIQLKKDDEQTSTCYSELQENFTQLQSIENEVTRKQGEFDRKYADLTDEIALFDEIILEYDNSLFSASNEYKEHVEDYAEDGKLDNKEYNKRKVPEIAPLESPPQPQSVG